MDQVCLSRRTAELFRPETMAMAELMLRRRRHSMAAVAKSSMSLARFLVSGCLQISLDTRPDTRLNHSMNSETRRVRSEWPSSSRRMRSSARMSENLSWSRRVSCRASSSGSTSLKSIAVLRSSVRSGDPFTGDSGEFEPPWCDDANGATGLGSGDTVDGSVLVLMPPPGGIVAALASSARMRSATVATSGIAVLRAHDTKRAGARAANH